MDLVKILKNCKRGTELYSPLYGTVHFKEIRENSEWPIFIEFSYKGDRALSSLTRDGKTDNFYLGECMLYPSKDQRDWSKFTAPWYNNEKFDPKTLKPFDRVLVRDCDNSIWGCSMFSHIVEDEFLYSCFETRWKCCIPYNDDTRHLVGTKDEAPEYYRYWED